MTKIPAFGSSLLTNPQVSVTDTKSVEDIINAPQQMQADSFAYSNQPDNAPQKRSWVRPLAYITGAVVMFFAGRKGVFGKHIQKWFGGLPSAKTVTKNIETKMQEYIGKGGNNVNKVTTTTAENGATLVTCELENGSSRLYQRFDTKNYIRLEGKTPDGKAEMIVFRKEDGTPVSRTLFNINSEGQITSYKSYKDATVLDSGFNDATGLFKSWEKGSVGKRFKIIGRTQRTDRVARNTNPNGNVEFIERTLIYDEPNKVTRIIVKNPDETVTYKKLFSQNVTNPDGTTRTISRFLDTDSKFKNPV